MATADFPSKRGGSKGTTASIEKAAAAWLSLREGREFTAEEAAAFAAWRDADIRHAAAIAELESAWRAFDRLAAYPRPAGLDDDPDFFARTPRFRRRVALPIALAAAASVAACLLFWLNQPKPSTPSIAVPVATSIDPRILHLSDGSEVELNEGCQVTEQFTPGERRVHLVRGEAQFTVKKDPTRPFIVEANGVFVRAVGTVFNVRLRAAEVEVLVTEGKVHVHSPATDTNSSSDSPMVELVALQRTVVSTIAHSSAAPAVEVLTPRQVDHALAWQTSRLVFDSTPLAEAVARFNRHTSDMPGAVRLVVADPDLAAMRISGRIRSDNASGFVELLETSFGVTADRSVPDEIILRKTP